MNKKLVSIGFAVVLLLLMVGYSRYASNSGEESNGSNISASTSSSTPSQKVKIEFYYGLGGKLGETMSTIIKEFNASNNNYEVIPVVQGNYSETLQALQASLGAKRPPALAINAFPEFMKLAKSDVLLPLDKYIEQPEYNKDDILQKVLTQGLYNDQTLGVPAYVATQVMYYRKDIFKKHNIDFDSLKNFEELAEVARKIKKEDGIYGWSIMWYTEHMIDYARSAGGEIVSSDGKTVTIDSAEWIYAWDTVRKLIHEEKVMDTVYGGNGWEWWYKTIDNVMNGRSAGYTGSSGDGGDLDFTKMATGMQKGFKGNVPRPVAVSVMFSLFKDSSLEEQEGAWQFINFFTSAEKTAYWATQTGYIPVRTSALDTELFKNKLKENPYADVPLRQANSIGIAPFVDPTGGKIYAEIELAKDAVLIENKPAAEALKKAQEKAQKELDKVIQK